MLVIILRTVAELRANLSGNVHFVPTMGYLHEGHQGLIRMAAANEGTIVMSLFVNPTQFNDPKDLEAYPRDEEKDAQLAQDAGCNVLFAPNAKEVYPEGSVTTVHVSGVSEKWEGAHRPGHFDGVATVVAKLFNMIGPCTAYFGEKDWQQCRVVERMARDLNLPVSFVFGETVRERDGLAMSSRNARLNPDARDKAPLLYKNLSEAAANYRDGMPATLAERKASHGLLADGFDKVDYVAIVDAQTLEPVDGDEPNVRIIAAATIGGIRLIDNAPV